MALMLLTGPLSNNETISPDNAEQLQTIEILKHKPWDLVMDVSWSPDGSILAVSSGEYVRLYKSSNLALIKELKIDSLSHSIKFSPDGKQLAVGSRDGVIRIWETSRILNTTSTSQEPDIQIAAHKKGVNSIAFDSANHSIASGGNDRVAKIWDIATGEYLVGLIGGGLTIPAVAFIPDDETLALENGNVIRLREIGTERISGTYLSEDPMFCLDLSPDGSLIAAGDLENRVMLWATSSAFRTGVEKMPEAEILKGHDGLPNSYESLVWDVQFNPAGDLIASAGGDGTVQVWDVFRRELLASFAAHPNGVTSIEFDPHGQILASGGLDGTVKLWGIRNDY